MLLNISNYPGLEGNLVVEGNPDLAEDNPAAVDNPALAGGNLAAAVRTEELQEVAPVDCDKRTDFGTDSDSMEGASGGERAQRLVNHPPGFDSIK